MYGRRREAVCHRGDLHHQDSMTGMEQSVEENMDDASSDAPQPQFALRQDLDSRRPTATVQVLVSHSSIPAAYQISSLHCAYLQVLITTVRCSVWALGLKE